MTPARLTPTRMRPPRLLIALAACAALAAPPLSSAARAQTSDTSEARGSRPDAGPEAGRRHGMRGEGRRTPPDPVVLEGPPAPDEFARIVELPTGQVARYRQLYERLIATTKPQRDSVAAMRRDLRHAYEQRDREAMRRQRGQFRPLLDELSRQQASFDDTLQPLLSKDQWKRYVQWREERRKEADEARKDRRRPA